MQCLYCGKGIGPIRQLRDLEFCSEAHRTQFRERYRQHLYEALAPEPAPKRLADFMERPAATGGPSPSAVLCVLPKPVPGECRPAMSVDAAGISAGRADWVFGQDLAAMPTRLVWQDSEAAYPSSTPPIRTVSFSMGVQPPESSTADAAPTHLAAGSSTARPLAAAARISETARPLPSRISLPEAAGTSTPVNAEFASPLLHAATCAACEPVAIGPVALAAHAVMALPANSAIARPAAPAGPSFSAEARPLEAGPVLTHCDLKTMVAIGTPVVFDTPGTGDIGIILPKPPTAGLPAGEQSESGITRPPAWAAEWQAKPPAPPTPLESPRPAISPGQLAPMIPAADPQPAGLPAAASLWHAARAEESSYALGPLGSHVSPQVGSVAPGGALAGPVQPVASAMQEAAGNRNPRPAGTATPACIEKPAARREVTALPGAMGSAPLCTVDAPTPAAPTAGAPLWDAARAVSPGHPLVPLANVALPRIDCMPAPAGAIAAGSGLPLRPDVGRAVRSCAVLWTLRVAEMCHPGFRVHPIRVRFNDLVRANMPYARDMEDTDHRPAKTNLRPLKRARAEHSGRPKWQYIGAAAAALLLAGVLRPQVAPKGFVGSLPWHGMSVHQWVSQRATRSFADNFRAGLDQWKGVQAKWPRSWSYSTDGFIHPGQLALFRPSVPLSDYRFEFMAQIEKKSVDWVVRAKDADNYYALKFTVLQPGPRPIVAMVRYPVIEGGKGARVQTPLRMMIHANTPYRVTVDVKGNEYRAYIEGQEADFWTEDRLKKGGVGFFSEAGESARVYWVKLESHGDILGRICGLLSGKGSEVATDTDITAMNFWHSGITEINGALGPRRAALAAMAIF